MMTVDGMIPPPRRRRSSVCWALREFSAVLVEDPALDPARQWLRGFVRACAAWSSGRVSRPRRTVSSIRSRYFTLAQSSSWSVWQAAGSRIKKRIGPPCSRPSVPSPRRKTKDSLPGTSPASCQATNNCAGKPVKVVAPKKIEVTPDQAAAMRAGESPLPDFPVRAKASAKDTEEETEADDGE